MPSNAGIHMASSAVLTKHTGSNSNHNMMHALALLCSAVMCHFVIL